MTENSRLEVLAQDVSHSPADQSARMRFFNAFLDSELCLLLSEDAGEETVSPIVATHEGAEHVFVFASEDNLAEYSEKVAPYAALSGRVIVDMLAQAGSGIAFNFGLSSSELILTAEEITWLNGIAAEAPDTHEARPTAFFSPGKEGKILTTVLMEKLLSAAALADSFWLTVVEYDNHSRSVLLIIIDACEEAEAVLAKAALEAVALSGFENLPFDVSFLNGQDKVVESVKRQGRPLLFPERPTKKPHQPSIPGMDPAKPPKLR